VREKIKKLRPSAAPGPDKIGPSLLQHLQNEVAPILTIIYRKSLDTGMVPEDWRSANVTPIYKKGSKADAGNYRPVSLTSVCCKILESLIRDSLMAHLMGNNLLKESQHGFMPGRSCTTNLLEFLEKVTSLVDSGEAVDVIFLDFAKAFDKVPWKRLLAKLRAHGIKGKVHRWVANWLSKRSQRVVLNGKASNWREVLSGVPQGSVLGPVLFLIFINNLDVQAALLTTVKKFADDTKLAQVQRDDRDRQLLQNSLDKLSDWTTNWGMAFNVKKCMVMHLGKRNKKHQYYMEGVNLLDTKEERDIGVIVSDTLKPSAQCAKAARTASVVLGQITRAFHYRDRHTFISLYKQYVLPHLEFAVQSWSPWLVKDKEVLEKVQRRAIKMVSGLGDKTYEEKLKELGMVTLEERRHQLDMVQVFKILSGHDRVEKDQWFKMAADSGAGTRQAAGPRNLIKPRTNLEIRTNFFSVRVIDNWNLIPAEIKMARNPEQFKKLYRDHRSSREGL
jgi:hypothetical protein